MAKVKVARKQEVPMVPRKYSGKWIAWSFDHSWIVASGESAGEARQKAFDKGEARVWLDKVPEYNVRFGGAAFRTHT